MSDFSYLDVCSGISAASLAWQPLDWRCAGYSEIDPFARAVLEQRHGAVAVDWDYRFSQSSNIKPLFGDFTKIEAHHVGAIDLLVGGTPCQSFSIAGRRLGLDDPRGNLAIEFLALARRICAEWVVWENVPAFIPAGPVSRTMIRLPNGKKQPTSSTSSISLGNAGIVGDTGLLTLNMSEWTATNGLSPSEGDVASLSDILETTPVPRKYYLSEAECLGILRRAEKRGKTLPLNLRQALEQWSKATSTLTKAGS